MNPPAFAAPLKGRVASAPKSCRPDCANVIDTAPTKRTTGANARIRLSRSDGAICATLYLKRHDRAAAIENPRMGRLRDRGNPEEHAHHQLRRREDLEPGEPEARAAVHQTRTHLVLQADEPDGDRRRRRRQHRTLYQSR